MRNFLLLTLSSYELVTSFLFTITVSYSRFQSISFEGLSSLVLAWLCLLCLAFIRSQLARFALLNNI